MKVLPKKEFQKWLFDRDVSLGMSERDAAFDVISTSAICTRPENEVVVAEGAGTSRKLHELGHLRLGRVQIPNRPEGWPEETTMGDIAYNEILAEKYSWETRGKKLTYRVGIPAIFALMYTEGKSPGEAVGVTIQVLEQYVGIRVPPRGKKELRRMAWKFRRVV